MTSLFNSTSSLSEEQAHDAMCHFLHELWQRYPEIAPGDLLGGLAVLADGGSADPAMKQDFTRAVRAAMGSGPIKLELKK